MSIYLSPFDIVIGESLADLQARDFWMGICKIWFSLL